MKKNILITALAVLTALTSCNTNVNKSNATDAEAIWKDYFVGNIIFQDEAP